MELGKYNQLEKIGSGRFGDVYKALDPSLDREVALKILKPEWTDDYEFILQFRNEAKLAAKIMHPNVVMVYEVGEYEGRVYICMEYLPGKSLAEKIEQARDAGQNGMPIDEAVRLLTEMAQGLAELHKRQVVHCDLKPSNVLLDEDGHAKIADLGLSISFNFSQSSRSRTAPVHSPGTPAYMSPEQEANATFLRPPSDVFSLGLILYEMLTLRNYKLEAPGTHLRDGRPDAPEWLDELLAKMLVKDNEQRLWDGAKVLEAIRSLQEEEASKRVEVEIVLKANAESKARTEAESQKIATADLAEASENADLLEQERKKQATLSQKKAKIEEIRAEWTVKTARKDGLQIRSRILVGVALLVLVLCGFAGVYFALNGLPGAVAPTSTAQPTTAAIAALTSTITALPTNTSVPTDTPPPTITPLPTLGIGSTNISPMDDMVQVYVPAGDFLMGASSGDTQADFDEHPQYTVYLDAFWIDRTEVTNGQYAKCVVDSACSLPSQINSYSHQSYYENSEYVDYPVIYVDWNQAKSYCAWAGRRLPTEAEWEKAARGTDSRLYPWGNANPTSDLLNFNQNVKDTSAVGSYLQGVSPYSVLDMAGNVSEWVANWYEDRYYAKSPSQNPAGPASGQYRVLRGGSWFSETRDVRASNRIGYYPDIRSGDIGFRCARSAASP